MFKLDHFKEESSISLAIMRVFLVIIAWTTWAKGLRTFNTIYISSDFFIFSLFFFTSSIFVLIGFKFNFWKYIYSSSLLILYFYYGWYKGNSFYIHHHSYLICISNVIISLGSASNSLSIDSIKLSDDQKTTKPFARLLICLQMSSMYFWTAFDKTNLDFLSGERLQQIFALQYFHSSIPQFPYYNFSCFILSIGVVIFEYTISIGLWIEKFKKFLIILGIIFHLALYILLPVGTFSVTVILLYLAFIRPEKIDTYIKKTI